MATLEFRAEPLPELHASDIARSIPPEVQLIQSMRGVASTVTILIPAWHLLLAAETADSHDKDCAAYPRRVTISFMKEAMFELVLIHLRRIFDESDRSLAFGTILRHLGTESVRRALVDYCLRLPDSVNSADVVESKINGLLYMCAPHVVVEDDIAKLDPRLVRTARQTALLRRAANKRAAHITLDAFEIDLPTLHDLVVRVVNISILIHSLIGERGGLAHLSEIDRAAYDQSVAMLGHRHRAGLLCDPSGSVDVESTA